MQFFRSLVAKLAEYWRELFASQPEVESFAAHNERIFPRATRDGRQSVVLVEFNEMQSAHIAYSYVANVLADEYGATIVAHLPHHRSSFWSKARAQLGRVLNRGSWRVYRSFGVTDFVELHMTSAIKARAKTLLSAARAQITNKTDLENLTIEGVWIGDLIYDTFLMGRKKPTVDLDSAEFNDWLLESLQVFAFWLDYFERHDVRAINVSHCVYNTAMPLRIAVGRGIPAFQVNATHAYRLRRDRVFAYSDYFDFPERFASLPDEVKRQGLDEAKKRIARRFAGEVGVDMSYSTQSAYGAITKERLLAVSDRPKVLIATHCFFDSPHSYGNNLFPDFWEWLDYLGRLTQSLDYDWYIKTHPDYLPGTMEIIQGFIQRYPRITLLPSKSSHNQIVAEGISAVLTVYGTIGFEYAAKGIAVINASNCNPHIAYDFNIHPTDLSEYRAAIEGIKGLQFDIDETEVYQYYYMKNIFNTENIFFRDYAGTISALGGYDAQFSSAVYATWLEQWSVSRHEMLLAGLRQFVLSGDFRMDYGHFNRGNDRVGGTA